MTWSIIKKKKNFVVGFYSETEKFISVYENLTLQQAQEKVKEINQNNIDNIRFMNVSNNQNDCVTSSDWVELICSLILDDILNLKDIPQKYRIQENCFYYSAFRVDRVLSKKRYLKDLKIVYDDAESVSDTEQKKWIKQVYDNHIKQMDFFFKD